MPDLRDHICGRHNKPFRDCGCLKKLAKDLQVWRKAIPLRRPCPNCGRKYTYDPGCTAFCSCACDVVHNTAKG
jgi:hypothetical protein